MSGFSWYATLRKPSWAPPPWIFGPVWSVLYAIIILSFAGAFAAIGTGTLPTAAALPFAINILSNLAFTPLQFGLRNNVLASIDILVVLASIIWIIAVTMHAVPWVALAQLPYLAWVTFATMLQLTITAMNTGRR